MTETHEALLARIDRALLRIERVTAVRSAPDERYARLRTRTQAALADLDAVIARVGRR